MNVLRFFVVLLGGLVAAQQQALMDYLETRLLAIEDRISLWHEQTSRYTSELRELKQQIGAQLEGLDKNKETLRSELDAVGVRVDRVEREMDYLETQNGAQPCVDVDDKLVEQQVTVAKERNKSKYANLTALSRTVVKCAIGQTEEFKVEVGLHQGSALSPFLFAMVMDQLSEEVRQESPWTMMFADDIVICSESREQVKQNLERWRFALERRGMIFSRNCSDMVSRIKGMKILKRAGGVKGMWTKDMGVSTAKVYLFNGTGEDTLYEFSSVRDFTSSLGIAAGKAVQLPSSWQGMGHAVYKNHLYYVKVSEEIKLVKFDLQKGSVVDSAVFPAKDQLPVYSLNSETYIDLAIDEEGLWAIYATKNNEKHVSLAKVDPKTLAIEQMWDTPCSRENAEAAFVVCGTVYVVYNSKLPSRSRIQCVFDVSDMVTNDDAPTVYFPKRSAAHSSLKYSPMEQLVYAWDDGYQILYKLQMKKKLDV
ncbi:hypothetical protein QTP70_028924 [Hemibagrus guttatus]|uniref:ribonuclease H n=1 Tax=Hemibagrus guttatus TaxID=175788 RepID=A0AAE0UPZ6_9TELE|nr:hypothetical protein QTP70_028924 [Hemibagrus guttatus]